MHILSSNLDWLPPMVLEQICKVTIKIHSVLVECMLFYQKVAIFKVFVQCTSGTTEEKCACISQIYF